MFKRSASVFVLMLAALVLFTLSGCELLSEPTVKNPWAPDGPPLTADQLDLEAASRIEAAERWAKEQAEQQAREADARLAEFEDATAELTDDCEARFRDLKRKYEQDSRVAADLTVSITRDLEATRRNVNAAKIAGHSDLSRQWEKRDSIAGGLQTAARSGDLLVPGLGALASGLVGALVGRAGRQKREDAAYDLGKQDAHDERDARDTTWDEAQAVGRPDPTVALLTTLAPALLAVLRPGSPVPPVSASVAPLVPPAAS